MAAKKKERPEKRGGIPAAPKKGGISYSDAKRTFKKTKLLDRKTDLGCQKFIQIRNL